MAFGVAETASLIVDLSLKGNFQSQLGKVNQTLAKTNLALDRTSTRAYRAGQQIGTGIKRGAAIAVAGIGLIASQVVAGVNSLVNLEKVTAQTNAVLKSTKGAAGQTVAGIRSLAEGFESLNAQMDDTVIQSGANVLLTFTNIRQKAFKPTLQAALDLSTAMGQDLQTSVVQIGKALNDPTKGLTSLQRIGVSFDKNQVKQIKNLVKHNKLFEAQGIILRELNKEFGGSFAAGGKTIAGQFASIGDAVEDLQRNLATAFLPLMSKVAHALDTTLRDPKVVQGIKDFGNSLAGAFTSGQIVDGLKSLTDSFGTLVDLVKIAAGPVKAIVGAFLSLPKEVQTVLVGAFAVNKLTGGLVTNVFGGIAEAIAKSFIRAPLVNVQGGVVNVGGGIPGGGGGGLGAAAAGAAIGTGTALTLIGASIAASIVSAIDRRSTITQPLSNQGLNRNEIVATLSKRDQATAQEVIKRSGIVPSAQDLSSAASKLEASAKLLNLEKPGVNRPQPGKQLDDLRVSFARGLAQNGKQIDDIARRINPKLTDLERRTDAGASRVASAVAANRSSLSQSIKINVNVTASGIHKTVTVQNRYGRATGSAHTDFNGNLGFGGAR